MKNEISWKEKFEQLLKDRNIQKFHFTPGRKYHLMTEEEQFKLLYELVTGVYTVRKNSSSNPMAREDGTRVTLDDWIAGEDGVKPYDTEKDPSLKNKNYVGVSVEV